MLNPTPVIKSQVTQRISQAPAAKVRTPVVDQDAIQTKLARLLLDAHQGNAIRDDLQSGLHTVPSWMQRWIRDLLARSAQATIEAQS